ncbi:hypothetical protein [Zooshikella harenae]|uniref:Uncharacterized protein n=1 Tax=Zooshikella harenae TaxID=2827238 RepID=A0ABS5ZI46_9GAMM|nr:hypothetical protein [Zooshikella harenae]MBU2713600.1 hypothetical protein [Zooshikella harenae]
MNKYYLLTLLLVITVHNITASEEISDEQKIDFYINTIVLSKCTRQIEYLCSKLKSFKYGDMPRITQSGHYVSEIHAGNMQFNKALEYHNIYALIYFDVKEGERYFSAFQFVAGDKSADQQVKRFMYLQNSKNNTLSYDLDRFILKHKRRQTFVQCEEQKKQLLCKQGSSMFKEVYFRAYGGDIYMFALGQVPKTKGSMDTTPGFYISNIGSDISIQE